ncbi:type II toxin-antitoxin system antitoxin, RelB/DinJ family, partial [Acinetobacter baumannii]|uniref:type II toxin-antitoxin system RelB/DinJ family antitoxin n=1 Tax=Acinetobacter baumannii TaxID=470 RepID=UPI001059AD53
MDTVNFGVDEVLKQQSNSILKEQGIALIDLFTTVHEYVTTTGKLHAKNALLSDEDEELLA